MDYKIEEFWGRKGLLDSVRRVKNKITCYGYGISFADSGIRESGWALYAFGSGWTYGRFLLKNLINKTLDYNPDVKCSHYEHGHGEGYTCGEHGCGSYSCH